MEQAIDHQPRASRVGAVSIQGYLHGDNIEASNFALPTPASSGISKDAAAIEMLKDRERKANYRGPVDAGKCRWDKCYGRRAGSSIFWPRNGIDNCCPGSIRRRGTSFCTIDIFYSTSLSMGRQRCLGFREASAPLDPDTALPQAKLGDLPGCACRSSLRRKGEKTPKELENRRQAFIRRGTQVRNFVRVDGTQPLNKVLRRGLQTHC